MKKRMICMLLCIMMLVSLLPTGAAALGETVIARDKAASIRDNVQMSKTVTEHKDISGAFDGTYDITLEAYANAYYKPVDVILVVDQSGSMTENSSKTNEKTNLANLQVALKDFAATLKDVDMTNRLTIIGFAGGSSNTELFNGSQVINYSTSAKEANKIYAAALNKNLNYYADGHTVSYSTAKQSWGYESTSGDSCKGEEETTTWNSYTPKESAGASGTQFYELSPTAYDYSIAAKTVTVNGAVNSDITASINALSGRGSTYTNYGMEMALNALASRSGDYADRDAIVVLFTDGYPGDNDTSHSDEAAALAASYTDKMKSVYGAKVYTVGLGGGSDYTMMSKFLKDEISSGEGYYSNTQDSAQLPDLFKMIYQDVIGVNKDMTANAKLVETLSDKFELNGTAAEAIKISQLPYQDPKLNNGQEWGTPYAVDGSVQASVNGDIVTVSGFDYAKVDAAGTGTNAVYYDSKGAYHGNKLRVVINVRPKAGSNTCWDGVEPGILDIVPTELSQLTNGQNSQIAAISSNDSDYFKAFQVQLHFLKVTADDQTVQTGTQVPQTTFSVLPNNGKYNVTGYSYQQNCTAASAAGDYAGAYSATASTAVTFTDASAGADHADITKRSVVRYIPGTVHLVSGAAYIVTISGHQSEKTYNGSDQTVSGYDVSVSYQGQNYTNFTNEQGVITVTGQSASVSLKKGVATSVTKKNAGTYNMGLDNSDFTTNGNVALIVNDGKLTINKVKLTMTSPDASKPHDGIPLTANNVTEMKVEPGFVSNEGVDFTIKGSQTEIGSSYNWFTYTAKNGTDLNNYIITEVMGTLTVTDGSTLDLNYYDRPNDNNNGYHSTKEKFDSGNSITLDLNGGTMSKPDTTWSNCQVGYIKSNVTESLTLTCVPTRDGYLFNGWTYSEDGGGNITLTAKWVEKGRINGTIRDPNGAVLAGVDVRLCQGNPTTAANILASTKTDANGYYEFNGYFSGEYDIVAVQNLGQANEKTKTALIMVPANTKVTKDLQMPASGLSSQLEVLDTNLKVVVGRLDEVAAQYTPGAGETIDVKMTVAPEANANGAITDAKKGFIISAVEAGDKQEHIEYYNITLMKTSSGTGTTDIGGTNQVVVQINVPFTTTGRTNFAVYSYHNGTSAAVKLTQVSAWNGTDTNVFIKKDNMITIFAKQFSVYAVAYDNVGGSTPGPSPSPAPGGGGGGAPAADVYNIYAPKTTKNGQATVSTDTSPAGETITVKTVSDKGYKATVTVTDKNGQTVTVTDAGNGVFTFVMPEADVNVKIKFVCLRDKYCPIEPFDDTLNDYWWHDGVHFCVEEKYMIGFPNDDFRPYALTNRAQIAAIFWRIEGSPVVDYDITFKDLQPNAWYTEAIRWAEMNHVVYGYSEDAFGPEDPVTREQLAAIIYRYAQSKGEGLTGTWSFLTNYTDKAAISNWAYDAACWCSLQNIVVGDEGAYKPLANATRAEAACMIQRFCETILGM